MSNWFINARVRLWKPMVEEMYSEEVKEQEQSGSQDDDNNNNNKRECNKESGSTTSAAHQSNSSVVGSMQAHSGFNLVGLSDMQRSPKQPRSSEMQNSPNTIISMDMDMRPDEASEAIISTKFAKERHGKDGYSFISDSTYSVGDFGRFNPEEMAAPRFQGNSVSLTLGLPHCENLSVSGAHGQQSFLSPQSIQMGRRSSLEMGTGDTDFCVINAPQASHSNTGYGNIDIQSRKRFAAQLLPDFVA